MVDDENSPIPQINLDRHFSERYSDLMKPSPTKDIVPQVATILRPSAIKPSTPKSAFKAISSSSSSQKLSALKPLPQRARASDVHEITREGATTTRISEQNQAIKQAIKIPPSRPSSETLRSEATTGFKRPQRPSSTIPERRGPGRPPGSKNKPKEPEDKLI
jgi:hypothetical protein